MSRAEIRKAKYGQETVAGSMEKELQEVQKLQGNDMVCGIETITAGCTEAFTIICC